MILRNKVYYSIIVYSLGNSSLIVLSAEVKFLNQRPGHYTLPNNTIGKLLFREKTIIYLVHNIPHQTKKKNTLKFNIIIIIKFTM